MGLLRSRVRLGSDSVNAWQKMSRSPSTHWVAGNPPHSKRVELKVAVALSLMSDERGGAGGGEGGGGGESGGGGEGGGEGGDDGGSGDGGGEGGDGGGFGGFGGEGGEGGGASWLMVTSVSVHAELQYARHVVRPCGGEDESSE